MACWEGAITISLWRSQGGGAGEDSHVDWTSPGLEIRGILVANATMFSHLLPGFSCGSKLLLPGFSCGSKLLLLP